MSQAIMTPLHSLSHCITGIALVVASLFLPQVTQAQYYYPQGYYPQYPQYPQQPQRPRPAQPARPAKRQQESKPKTHTPQRDEKPSPEPGSPRKSSGPKDTSGDAPVSADISGISGPMQAYTWDFRDNLGDLAKAAGISSSQLMALNHLSHSQLRNGQVLKVPRISGTSSSLKIASSPQAQMAREVWRGVRGKKQVALTYDAGGEPDGLEELIRNLKEHDAPATFFATGQFAVKHPDKVKFMAESGFPVHNHSYSHPEFTKLSADEMVSELSRTDAAIKKATGSSTKPYWRPPFGDRNRDVLETAARAGYRSIYWTHDSLDSVNDKKDKAFVENQVLNPPRAKADPDNYLDGGIILMHIGEIGTAKAAPQIIKELRKRGFTLVTVDEILKP